MSAVRLDRALLPSMIAQGSLGYHSRHFDPASVSTVRIDHCLRRGESCPVDLSLETDADTFKGDTGEPCCPNLAGQNWKSPGQCSRGNDFTRREGRVDVIM